jgi:hypothetical protein
MKEEAAFGWKHGKYYRCKPALYESVVSGSNLLDIDGFLMESTRNNIAGKDFG